MRRPGAHRVSRVLGLLVLLAALAACGDGGHTPSPTPGPEAHLRLFVEVARSGVVGEQAGRTVPIGTARDLTTLARPGAFPGGKLPTVPRQIPGSERYAALLTGCRETEPPRLFRHDGSWVARFPKDRPHRECFAPEYYVAVWDVGGNLL